MYLGKEPDTALTDFTRATANETITGTWTFTSTIQGTALQALWADLAERYSIDETSGSGLAVKVGGEKEITLATNKDTHVLGITSTQPALRMNSEAGDDKTHPYIALTGRVPCFTVGKVEKGQRLVISEVPGISKGYTDMDGNMPIYAIALDSKDSEGIDLIEVFVSSALK